MNGPRGGHARRPTPAGDRPPAGGDAGPAARGRDPAGGADRDAGGDAGSAAGGREPAGGDAGPAAGGGCAPAGGDAGPAAGGGCEPVGGANRGAGDDAGPAAGGGREPAGGADRGAGADAGPGDGLASAAAEAARLAEAAGEWARRSLPELVAVLRGERPGVTERVAEAGTAVAAALRAVRDALTTPADATGRRPGGGHSTDGPPPPRVQRIEVDQEDTP